MKTKEVRFTGIRFSDINQGEIFSMVRSREDCDRYFIKTDTSYEVQWFENVPPESYNCVGLRTGSHYTIDDDTEVRRVEEITLIAD